MVVKECTMLPTSQTCVILKHGNFIFEWQYVWCMLEYSLNLEYSKHCSPIQIYVNPLYIILSVQLLYVLL